MIGVVRMDAGGDGQAVSMAGEIITLQLPRAFAPGAPFRGAVILAEREIALEGRTVGSRKTADGTFEVRVRVVNMVKDDRLRLTAGSPSE
jgi:hypothetical protein